jgi:hypothetical protein
MKRLLVSWFLAILCAGPLLAQCPGGNCPAPSLSPTIGLRPGYQWCNGWYADESAPGWLKLYFEGSLVGRLQPASGQWQTAGKTAPINLIETFHLAPGKASRPPGCLCDDGECCCGQCPQDCAGRQQMAAGGGAAEWNFGLVRDKLTRPPAGEVYSRNGRPIEAQHALTALAGLGVPDDSRTARLVVLGSDAGRQRVLNDLATSPALTAFKDKAIVQAYPADHWTVAEAGYKQVGDPTIYLVDAKGKVVTWQQDYDGGAPRLAKTLTEGLRQADPNFDPLRVPDLSKPAPPMPPSPTPAVGNINPNFYGAGALAGLVAGGALLAYRNRRK